MAEAIGEAQRMIWKDLDETSESHGQSISRHGRFWLRAPRGFKMGDCTLMAMRLLALQISSNAPRRQGSSPEVGALKLEEQRQKTL